MVAEKLIQYGNKSCRNESNAPPKALFPETVTLNLLLGSGDPDYCNFKMVSSWPPRIQFKEKRDVCKTCMPPLWHPILNITYDYKLLS